MGDGTGLGISSDGNQTGGRCSADDLLQLYPEMGIPNFQRGLVWRAEAVSLLLESLYYGTPCGSVILWPSDDPLAHGIPLGTAAPRFLIVDGQQRIRSLSGVFNEHADDEAKEDESNGSDPYEPSSRGQPVWCLNLGQVPELKSSFKGGKRFHLFRRVTDPKTLPAASAKKKAHGAVLQDREALLPLKWFLVNDRDQLEKMITAPEHLPVARAVEAVLATPAVESRLRQLRTSRLFHVSFLTRGHTHRDVIAIYNRINSSGEKVEAEERAYAHIVAQSDRVEGVLRQFFDRTSSVVKVGGPGQATQLRRDGLLERHKESRFGFKLFMRVVAMFLAYHQDRAPGSSSLSFDAVVPDALADAGAHLDQLLEASSNLLVTLKAILRDELFCDDVRMLPETTSLWPVIQLLIRFPDVASTAPKVVAALVLRLMVVDRNKRELLALCNRVNTALSAKDALNAFEGFGLTETDTKSAIVRGVAKAQSLTDRFALLAYWLVRRRGAKDFSYEANNLDTLFILELRKRYGAKGATASTGAPALAENIRPQKQHIVPYARLKTLFGLSRSRPGSHAAHDIGNITYISEGLNGAQNGVGSRFLNLRDEPAANREAHFLGGDELLRLFEDLRLEPGHKDADRPAAERAFKRFCTSRRSCLATDLEVWESELRAHVAERSVEFRNLRFVPRLIRPRLEDEILALGYDTAGTHLLLQFAKRGAKRSEVGEGALVLSCQVGGRQVIRIDLFPGGSHVTLKLMGKELPPAFKTQFPSVAVDAKEHRTKCRVEMASADGREAAADVLSWLLGRFPGAHS